MRFPVKIVVITLCQISGNGVRSGLFFRSLCIAKHETIPWRHRAIWGSLAFLSKRGLWGNPAQQKSDGILLAKKRLGRSGRKHTQIKGRLVKRYITSLVSKSNPESILELKLAHASPGQECRNYILPNIEDWG